jgi:cytochrome P450
MDGNPARLAHIEQCETAQMTRASATGGDTDFEPARLGEVDDPYPIFAALRSQGPSVLTASGYRCVVGFAAAEAVFRDGRFQSGLIATRYRESLPPGAARDELSYRINFLDPPDHPRVRGIVSRAFTPARVRDLRPWVEATAEQLLDEIESAGEEPGIDLRARFAHALPSLVISEMLGVPVADREQLTGWTEAVTPLLGVQIPADLRQRAFDASDHFAAYAAELVDQRRRAPGSDLLSAMVAEGDDGERLSREELLSLVVTLYSAGHRTTRDLFTNGLFTLLRHPDQYAALVVDPTLAPGAVEEFLRYETPTLYVARVPVEDTDIAGAAVPAFTPTLVMLAAANRDPERFTDPDRFDIHRDEGSSLSFAFGPHHCLGAALARMEADVMLRAVTRRWPRLTLAAADHPAPNWWSSGPFRGLDRLWVDPRR